MAQIILVMIWVVLSPAGEESCCIQKVLSKPYLQLSWLPQMPAAHQRRHHETMPHQRRSLLSPSVLMPLPLVTILAPARALDHEALALVVEVMAAEHAVRET